MVHGIESIKSKKQKSLIDRDIEMCKDIQVAYSQGGKAVGDILKSKDKKKKNK